MPIPNSWAFSAAGRYLSIARFGSISNNSAYGPVYNSTRSAPVRSAYSTISGSGSTKILTRMREACNWFTTPFRKLRLRRVSQPWLEVNWLGSSGTNVTCVGRISVTSARNSSVGLPSTFSSVVTIDFSWYTSSLRICRSSGRGCTVMPCAPNNSQSTAKRCTSGRLPPRALRSVATLLIFTLSFVMSSILKTPQKYCFFLTYANFFVFLQKKVSKRA